MSIPIADDSSTTVRGRPAREGANIRTWIGFKHFMYLVEEAVLQWYRERGLGPRTTFQDLGVGLAILGSSVQLPHLMEIDDEVVTVVERTGPGRFAVRLCLDRPGAAVLALRGRVTVGLVGDPDRRTAAVTVPEPLTGLVRPPVPVDALAIAPPPRAQHTWRWRARYFHCHCSRFVQHSAYVRCLEEVVDRFLESRGLPIPHLLEERGWIPVVSRARVELAAPSYVGEEVVTTFGVREVLKDRAFDASMSCHVVRDGAQVLVATASVLHGYAMGRGPRAGHLVQLDDSVQRLLLES